MANAGPAGITAVSAVTMTSSRAPSPDGRKNAKVPADIASPTAPTHTTNAATPP